jgi:hypothetical protein
MQKHSAAESALAKAEESLKLADKIAKNVRPIVHDNGEEDIEFSCGICDSDTSFDKTKIRHTARCYLSRFLASRASSASAKGGKYGKETS